MVKVIEDARWRVGKTVEHDLAELIANEIGGNLDDGMLEAARQTADGAAMTVARMIDLLVSKKIITVDEAMKVAGIQFRDLTLSPEALRRRSQTEEALYVQAVPWR